MQSSPIVGMRVLFALLVLLALSVSSAAGISLDRESNSALREARLRNLAETIAELRAEARHEDKTMMEVNAAPQPAAQTAAGAAPAAAEPPAPAASAVPAASAAPVTPAATPAPPVVAPKPAPVPRVSPKLQGTNRKDLVALYRFDDPKNVGRGFGGPGKNLKRFGKGLKVVQGDDAKLGRGSLFVPARSTAVPKVIDPKNPYQNSYLAVDAKGTPIKGLPKGSSSYTVAAWYSVSAAKPGRFGVVSFGAQERGQANLFKVTDGGQTVASNYGDSPLESTNPRDVRPTWHHGAVVWDEQKGMLTIYTDGKVSATRNMTENPPAVAKAQFFLGMSANGPESEQFSGFLDDVAIFRVALNPDEIRRIKRGNFEPYLDLFALRKCKTHAGRRQHGAGFVRGAPDETISIDNDKFKYGFETSSAFACSVKCAGTTNCRQSVFMADAPKFGAKPRSAGSRVPGRCYLMSSNYSTFEDDKTATTTVCEVPARSLQRNSFNLKLSADFAEQQKKKDIRLGKEPKPHRHLTADEKEAAQKAQMKEAQKLMAAEAKGAKLAQAEAAKTKAKLAKKAAALRKEHAAKTALEKQLAGLRKALDAKEKALKESRKQSSHREMLQRKKSASTLRKLSKRLAKVEKHSDKKRASQRSLDLAAKIKAEADKKASEILAAARKEAAKVKAAARKAHARKLAAKRKDRQARAARKAMNAARNRLADAHAHKTRAVREAQEKALAKAMAKQAKAEAEARAASYSPALMPEPPKKPAPKPTTAPASQAALGF